MLVAVAGACIVLVNILLTKCTMWLSPELRSQTECFSQSNRVLQIYMHSQGCVYQEVCVVIID